MVNRNLATFAANYFQEISEVSGQIDYGALNQALNLILATAREKKSIYICGNGGSAATANHFVTDLNKGVNSRNSFRIRAISLSQSVSDITAYGNDEDFIDIFSSPLKYLAEDGDLLIVISVSGNSPNIVKAVQIAKQKNCRVISLTGNTSITMRTESDINIAVNSSHFGVVEDIHMSICHLIAWYLIENG